MRDIEERLRALAERQRHARGDYMDYGRPDPELIEAADEIARLRAEIAALKAARDMQRASIRPDAGRLA